MTEQLLELKDRLQLERKKIVDRLSEIDENLTSINNVLDLLQTQQETTNKSQKSLITIPKESGRFTNMPFKKAVKLLLKSDPEKTWAPKDIFTGLLNEGFQSESKNFKNTARTMLLNMRTHGELRYIETPKGYLYSYKDETRKGSDVEMVRFRGDQNESGSEIVSDPLSND